MTSEEVFQGFSARKPRNSGTTPSPPSPSTLPGPPPPPTPDLAGTFALFAQLLTHAVSISTSDTIERNNVRDPDLFDGSNSGQLRVFFAQLELVFKARPRTFNSDEKKVTYALSYLKGTALQWFEPYLLEGDSETPPVFMSDYQAFQDELRVNFGPYDISGDAEQE
ncbi:hypothetical protein BN946_scf184672.g1, partial [Trametes cinnabarina]